MKLLDHLLHTTLHPTRYRKPPRYLNIGFLTTHGNLKEICLELNPTITALQISHIVASYLRLPREFDSSLQVSLLPYGFESNDPRLLDFIARFPRNLVDREKFIHNLAPRRPGFPKLPAQRYRGRTLDSDDHIQPLLYPWKQKALHLWVWLTTHDERILRYQNAVENCQLIIQEKERINTKCQDSLKSEVSKAYKLKYSFAAGDEERRKKRRRRNGEDGYWIATTGNEKRYRCQITDEYFTLDRMVATTIYPHTLMMDLPGLNEKVVDMLTGPENMLLVYWPVARMFDEGLITIEKLLLDDPDVIDGENTDEEEEYEEEEYGYFLRVNYARLLDSRVFAKEDWENREHRERLRWKHIDGKRITFSDDGQMVPYPDFLAFHSQLSTVIFGEIELMESEDDVQNTLAHIFERRSDLSISDTSSVFSITRPDSPGPPRWQFPLFK
ncbi:hypothetical protein TWF679_008341 [Orbilia oligospora]|uniref:Uncharacterized protein n=1 Tax=Orbilia oligospora TaxID=2813651 RepID=A0A8H8V5G1_ORBOL|nr:hypothetical protein TWF679_008341 [Orbilia oligospora]